MKCFARVLLLLVSSEVFPSILKITQNTYRGNPDGLSERALGETQVASIFWVVLKMANGFGLAINAKTFNQLS